MEKAQASPHFSGHSQRWNYNWHRKETVDYFLIHGKETSLILDLSAS